MKAIRTSIANLLAFGVLTAAVLVARAATQEATSYRFDGRLGYSTSDGVWKPVLPDGIFFGWGEGGCEIDAQAPERLAVYPDGTFTLHVFMLTTTVVPLRPNGSSPQALPAVTSWPCYRFRVKGCDDAVVPFGPKPPRATIEMSCPGRP